MSTVYRWTAPAVLSAMALGMGCGGDPAPSGAGRQPGTAGEVQEFLEEALADQEAYLDGADRLLQAVATGSADGVTLSGDERFQTGTLEVDLDGDGMRETPLSVSVFRDPGNPNGPIDFSVDRAAFAVDEDAVSVGAEASVNETGDLAIAEGYFSVEAPTFSLYAQDGSGTIPIPEAEGGTVLGSIGFSAFDEDYEDIIGGRLTFEVTVSGGGLRILVTVNDDPETPEDESREFYVE